MGPPPRNTSRRLLLALAIFILAALPRLAVVLSGIAPYASDAGTYLMPARHLAAGRGYVDDEGKPYAFRPPTYPVFLAAIFAAAGESHRAAMVVQALLAAAGAAGLAVWVARRQGKGAGAAAGTLVALDPVLIPVPAFILTEALGTVLVVGTVMCLDRGLAVRRSGWFLAAGFLGGACALNTPITLLFVPWLLLMAWIARSSGKPDWRGWLFALGMTAVVVGLWTGRNALERPGTPLIRDNGFASLVWATTEYDFDWFPTPADPAWAVLDAKLKALVGNHSQGEAHTIFLRAAWRNVVKHPFLVAKRVAKANFWFWVEVPGHQVVGEHRWIWWGTRVFHWGQLIAFLVALGALWRAGRLRPWSLWISAVCYFALFLSLMWPIPRYYVPVLPVMDTIIAVGLVTLARPRASRSPQGLPLTRAA